MQQAVIDTEKTPQYPGPPSEREKPTKTTSLRLQTILVVFGDGFNAASTLITSMILARIMLQSDMGTYRQILLIGSILILVFEMAISSSVYRFWNIMKGEDQDSFGLMIFFFLCVLGIIAGLAMALVAYPLARLYNNPDRAWALLITAPFPISIMLPKMVRPVWISQGRSWQATSFDFILAFTSIIALIIPRMFGATFQQTLMWWSFSNIMNVPCTIWALNHFLHWKKDFLKWNIVAQVWKYLWPIQISRMPTLLLTSLDKFVISTIATPAAFAIYSLGARELPFVSTINTSMAMVMVPRMVGEIQREQFDRVSQLWRSACEKTAIFIYPVGAFAVVYSLPLVKFLFSSQYEESSIPLRIFAFLIFVRIVDYASIATALGRSDLILKLTVMAVGSLIVLSVPLTLIFGANGMAVATVLSTALGSWLYLFEYRHLLKVPILRFFPLPDLLETLIIAFVAVGLGYWSQIKLGLLLNPDGFLNLVVLLVRASIITAIFYVGLLLIF